MLTPIDAMCRVWGAQKRRIITGRTGSDHVDGWPQATVLAKIREMGENAGVVSGALTQRVHETYTNPDALKVHRATQGMPEPLASVLFVHYVLPRYRDGGVKRKAYLIEQSTREYWRNVDRAHHWIAARIAAEDAIERASVEP